MQTFKPDANSSPSKSRLAPRETLVSIKKMLLFYFSIITLLGLIIYQHKEQRKVRRPMEVWGQFTVNRESIQEAGLED